MMKISRTCIVSCFVLVLVYTEVAMTLSLGISRQMTHDKVIQTPQKSTHHLSGDDPPVKRVCDGFPCMYSHLGTKAGKASLYQTLAGFIDECFNDPMCDPGRRKRQNSVKRIRTLINMPLKDLRRRAMQAT